VANLSNVLSLLRDEESTLETQLSKIRNAIGALSGRVTKAVRRRRRQRAVRTVMRKARTMTASQRKAVSIRMRKYWAARRKANE